MQQVSCQNGSSQQVLDVADNQEPKQEAAVQDDQMLTSDPVLADENASLGIASVDEAYPEGGWQAWLVVFGSFCGLFASLGLMNSIAIFQTYLGTHQLSDYSEGTIGWIFSLSTFFSFFCGIYVGPLFDKFGPRYLLLPGGIGIVLSLMLASLSTREYEKLVRRADSPGNVAC